MSDNNWPAVFEKAKKISVNHQNTLVGLGLVTATVLVIKPVSGALWMCPCITPSRVTYICLFTFAPAVVLLCLGFLMNNTTWHICQGFRRSESHKCSWSCCEDFCLLTLRALIPPAVWIFLLAFDGRFFACYKSTRPCSNQDTQSTFGNESNTETNQIIDENDIQQRSTINSRIFGWSVLIAVFPLKSAYLQADLNIRRFLAQRNIKKEDWDSISVPPQRNVDLGDQDVYTPLQAWVYKSGMDQTARIGLNENSPKFQPNESSAPPSPNTVTDMV